MEDAVKLINGEAVLVIFKAGEAPEIGVFDEGCVYLKDHDGVYAIGCSPSHCDLIPLRLARLAGEMAEALETCVKWFGEQGDLDVHATKAIAVLAKAGIEVPND